MNIRMQMRRSLLSLALFALVGAAAHASDETTIAVKTRAGTIERVDAGDLSTLQPNETRALSTRSGSAATITRTESGVMLAIAGDQYPIDMPVDVDAAGIAGEKIVMKHKDGDSAHDVSHEAHRIVMIKHKEGHDDAHAVDEALAGLPDLDDDEALLAAGDGPKVFVRRTKVLEKPAAQ